MLMTKSILKIWTVARNVEEYLSAIKAGHACDEV